jgi:hypothetical protein
MNPVVSVSQSVRSSDRALRTILVASAGVYAVLGLAFLLAAGLVLPLYGGMSMEPPTERFLGAMLIGFAVVGWFARNASDGPALRAIVLGNLVANAIGIVVALLAVTVTGASAFGWSTVAISLLLALGYGYVLIARPGEA